MLFRQAALVILAGVLPLAAAGTVAPMTRTWIRKVTSWMLALICYKPAAAAVYAAAFTMIGSGGSPRTMLMGFVMLALSVVTLPALMKFFTWTTGSIAGTGGGGQLLGAAAMGAVAVGAMRGSPGGGGGGPAQDQAAYLSSPAGFPARRRPAGRPGRLARLRRAAAWPRRRSRAPARPPQRRQPPAPRAARRAEQPPAPPAGTAGSPAAATPTGAATAGRRECRVRRISRRRRSRRRSRGRRRGRSRSRRRGRRRRRPGRRGCRAPGHRSDGTRGLAMTPETRPGPHLRRMAAQPQHRTAGPGPGRHLHC